MRAKSLLTWFSPLLASAAVVPQDLSALSTPTYTPAQPSAQFEYTSGSNGALLTFDVARKNDDDTLHFSIQVTQPLITTNCDDLQIAVNGEDLIHSWTYDKFGHASSPSTRITVVEDLNQSVPRSISLQSTTFCVQHDGPSEERKVVKITTFQVVSVDNEPMITLVPQFTTTFVSSPLGLEGDLNYPEVIINHSDAEGEIPRHLTRLIDLNIDDEIARLYQLDEEFKSLENLLEGQKALVENLNKAYAIGSKTDLRECDTVGCVLKTLYFKLRFLFNQLRYKLDSEPSPDQVVNDDVSCVYATSPLSRAKVLVSNQRLCATSNTTASIVSSKFQNPASPSVASTAPKSGQSRTRTFFTTLDIVAIFLSLSCLTIYFHSRCCNPRRCAERAARREERRNRRAYRNLARKQAWKNWWNRRLFRRVDELRTQDYEEKRTMIAAQEAVLENAMQHQIRQLRDAEEGLNSGSASESGSLRGESSAGARLGRARTYSRPPTYRSRASSGRPPSYNEVDASGRRVSNGFSGYTPSGTTMTPSGTFMTPSGSDCTPDSSVISLSPRHSSETLRTELSAL